MRSAEERMDSIGRCAFPLCECHCVENGRFECDRRKHGYKESFIHDEHGPATPAPSTVKIMPKGKTVEFQNHEIADDKKSGPLTQRLNALAANMKPSNPKDALGVLKSPLCTVSAPVIYEVGLGMLEGAIKYGRHNYRVIGVRASVYYDATLRHLASWWEGEDLDPDSGLSHVTKAICSLVVLRDAMIQQKFMDDRPPRAPDGWLAKLNDKAKELLKKYPDAVPAYTELNKDNPR